MTGRRTTRLMMALAVVMGLGCIAGCGEQQLPSQVPGGFGTVGGGKDNEVGQYATVCGGSHNAASAYHATICGGSSNAASVGYSFVGGGERNTARATFSTIGGGYGNITSRLYATVGGGGSNTASGTHSSVGGGSFNIASGRNATIAGGRENVASGTMATVDGGAGNTAAGFGGTIGGGAGNLVSETYATIGGGLANDASEGYSTVSGGYGNTGSGSYATVPGGLRNTAAGDYSFASGRRAKVATVHQGTFLYADSNDFDFRSAAADEFAVRATGGVRLVTQIDGSGSPTLGAELPAGSGSWSSLSSQEVKANVAPAEESLILSLLAELPISTWNYAGQDPSVRHIGPMAQDFYAAFGVGEDDRHISMVDADGVALAAIQALYRLVREKDVQIAALEARVAALEEASRMDSPAPCTQGKAVP